MTHGVNTIVSGNSHSSSNRWGDYQALGIDPVDGCTFWFTGQYMPSTLWGTRIASFRFPSCGQLSGSAAITPSINSGQIGHTLSYTLQLTSTSSMTQTWWLTPTAEWPALSSPAEITLSPNSTATANVQVTIPPTLTSGITESVHITITDAKGGEAVITATAVAELPATTILTTTSSHDPTTTLHLDWSDQPGCATDLYHSNHLSSGFNRVAQGITPLYDIILTDPDDVGFYYILVDCGHTVAISEKTGYIRFDLDVAP